MVWVEAAIGTWQKRHAASVEAWAGGAHRRIREMAEAARASIAPTEPMRVLDYAGLGTVQPLSAPWAAAQRAYFDGHGGSLWDQLFGTSVLIDEPLYLVMDDGFTYDFSGRRA